MNTKIVAAVPPKTAFMAVLQKSTNAVDGDVEKQAAELQQPLLPPAINNVDDAPSPNTRCLKVVSFLIGSFAAFLSQYLLTATMWDDTILSSSTATVVKFSFLWSLYTCIIIFGTMLTFVKCVERKYAANSEDNDDDEELVFTMEAHHITGALLSICFSWIIFDVDSNSSNNNFIAVHPYVLTAVIVAAYVAMIMLIARQNSQSKVDNNNESSILPTYQMLAATLGLIIGACSQFVLSMLLWSKHMTVPVIDNVILFSIIWSVSTVIITFAGCLSLRCLTVETQHDKQTKKNSCSEGRIEQERIILRMESHYVFTSLIGICASWIALDLCLGMNEQILPSIIMLMISLAAFRTILYCFPEDKCLEELEMIEKEKKKKNNKKPEQQDEKQQQALAMIQIV